MTIPHVLIGEMVTVWAQPPGNERDRVAITKPFTPGVDERRMRSGGTVTFEWLIHKIEE